MKKITAKEIREQEQPEVRFRDIGPIKFKDRPVKRQFLPIHLKDTFGFVPEVIVFHKVPGNNRFIVRAVLTPEELAKELNAEAEKKEKMEKELAKKNAELDKKMEKSK